MVENIAMILTPLESLQVNVMKIIANLIIGLLIKLSYALEGR